VLPQWADQAALWNNYWNHEARWHTLQSILV